MGAVRAIAGREVRGVLGSLFGVGLAAGFAGLSGILVIVDLRGNVARLDQWFGALFVALGLLSALLVTRVFVADDRELLLTAPLESWQVVAGKFLGVAGVTAVIMTTTVAGPIFVGVVGSPDGGPIVTGYVGVAFVALAFVAVGIAVAAGTSGGLSAGAGTAGLLLALWFGGLLGRGLRGRPRVALDDLSPATHVTGYLRGTLSLADALYFVTITVIGLGVAGLVWRNRR